MEAASAKRGRGRPRAHPWTAGSPNDLFTAKSARGRNNYAYAIDAMSLLDCIAKPGSPPTPFPHLVDWKAAESGRRGAVKYGALTELGRAAREFHPDVVRMIATKANDALGDGRLATARDAELQIREWRAALRRKPDEA